MLWQPWTWQEYVLQIPHLLHIQGLLCNILKDVSGHRWAHFLCCINSTLSHQNFTMFYRIFILCLLVINLFRLCFMTALTFVQWCPGRCWWTASLLEELSHQKVHIFLCQGSFIISIFTIVFWLLSMVSGFSWTPWYSGGQNCSNVFYFWKELPVLLEIKY